MTGWLEALREGDAVIVVDASGRRSLDKVSRLTPKQILLAGTDRRFRKNSGGEVGGGTWTAWQLAEATPEAVAQMRERRRINEFAARFRQTDWRSLPLATLEAVAAAMDAKEAS